VLGPRTILQAMLQVILRVVGPIGCCCKVLYKSIERFLTRRFVIEFFVRRLRSWNPVFERFVLGHFVLKPSFLDSRS